ncbi:MAG: helix-turn-helix domain-containing protein [Tannerellaceae bacterium]|jgi:ligand-binding sensor domain-containing protein/AraC-like DNA-binding protein|nr:helix-turn-helix domain-containing protein [Tannerellaceae bacterium]
MRNRYITLLGVGIFPLLVFAQQIMDLPQLPQLPIHSVHRIFQDQEGYIWYGTSDGLCRDDGYNVQVFRSDWHHRNVMQSNLIWTIAEDMQNRIWFGTDKGVYILNKTTFRIHQLDFPDLKDEKIITLNSTSDGCMWVGIPNKLYRFSPDETLKTLYPIDKGYGRVDFLYEDNDHNIWICIGGEGLCKLDIETQNIVSFSEKRGAHENFIVQDKSRKYYWVGTWGNSIKRFDPSAAKDSMYTIQPATQSNRNNMDNYIINMVQDDVYGYVWAITLNNVLAFRINSQGQLEKVNTASCLSPNNKMLSEIIKDKDKNLWIAAYDRKSFILNLQDSYVNEYEVQALQQKVNGNPAIVSLCKDDDDDDLFWLSQDRYGIYLYSPEREMIVYYNDCAGTQNQPLQIVPYLIKSKKKGKIWAMSDGSSIYGVKHVDMNMYMEETIDLRDITDRPGILETIYEDGSGNLWMGTTTGLFVYYADRGTMEAIGNIEGNVGGITQTADRAVWACVSKKGVYKIENANVSRLFPNDKDLSCIDATSDGKLWIGTFSGEILLLDPLSEDLYTDYSRICDMKGDVLEMVLVDAFNHVWILTNQEVKEFNPRNNVFRDYSAPRKSFLLDRFLPRSAYKAADNTMYFGGIPGFISIRASNSLESIPKPVKPVITNIKVGDESLFYDKHMPLSDNGGLDIESDAYNIEISFSILDYWNAGQIRYAYKLSGVNKDWNYVTNGDNTAFYNRLNKGKYTFQVKATDENGLWSDHVAEITINRLPAWYETWWAYSIYFLFFVAIVWNILYIYQQKVKQKNNRKIIDQVTHMKMHYSETYQGNANNFSTQNSASGIPSIEINRMETLSLDEKLTFRALEVVEANLGNPDFDVPKLAEQLNMTRITLSRKIKAITGQTPLEFMRDIKMKHACRMLENPAMSVTEVITALGYSDHGHFTATFKNLFGITPSEYQKKKNSSHTAHK